MGDFPKEHVLFTYNRENLPIDLMYYELYDQRLEFDMLHRAFLQHPAELGESYSEHQRTAFVFAGTLLAAGCAALVHGLLPCCFETTASGAVSRLHARMQARNAAAVR